MKLVTRTLSLIALVALTTFYVGCDKGGGESQTEAEKQFIKLKSNWTLISANDGTDRTANFPGLILTLDGTFAQGGTFQYSFTGTRPNPSPWPISGFWKFGTNAATQIIRDPGSADELDATYEVTADELEISFTVPDGHPGWAGSRVESVSGAWTFRFDKQ